VEEVSVVDAPTQILVVPVIADTEGKAFTVIIAVAFVLQPNALTTEYVTVTVPEDIPETTPDVSIVATEILLTDHVPPETDGVTVVFEPTHKLDELVRDTPVGTGFTVTDLVT
jgi:hypothetical protein